MTHEPHSSDDTSSHENTVVSLDSSASHVSSERKESIRALVSEFIEKLSLPGEVTIEEPALLLQGAFVCQIHVNEGSNLLIGQRGLNLEALQTLIRLSARRKFEGWADFSIDVNSYWKDKSRALFAEARDAETKAHQEKSAVFLRPMTPFERKCVHMALATSETVQTESTGIGENRKIIVKPKRDI